MIDYKTLTATEIIEGVKSGKYKPLDIVNESLSLAEKNNSRLNAFITLCNEKAIEHAKLITKEKPLCGLPVAVKDNICYKDYPTTCGSKILRDFVSPYNATVVDKLMNAGAVIIGKTNMDEFGMGSSSETSYFGPVKNPFDDTLVPGGSSGGSAVAVASGIVPVALGTDTGGSIRQPAAFCGIYGLKPTYGAVSRYGLIAYVSSADQIGVMARNVQDLVLVYKVIAGYDEKDSTSINFDHPDYSKLLETDKKFTIGILSEYSQEVLDPEIKKGLDDLIIELKKMGHSIREISIPHLKQALPAYYIIANAEASSNLARYDGMRFGHRTENAESLEEVYAQSRAEGFGDEVKRRIMLGTYVLSSGYYDEYYIKASKVRELIRQDFEKAFNEVDLILSPTTSTSPFKLGEKINDPLSMYMSDVYTVSANLAGIPALNIPLKNGDKINHTMCVGGWFKEEMIFQLARQIEKMGI